MVRISTEERSACQKGDSMQKQSSCSHRVQSWQGKFYSCIGSKNLTSTPHLLDRSSSTAHKVLQALAVPQISQAGALCLLLSCALQCQSLHSILIPQFNSVIWKALWQTDSIRFLSKPLGLPDTSFKQRRLHSPLAHSPCPVLIICNQHQGLQIPLSEWQPEVRGPTCVTVGAKGHCAGTHCTVTQGAESSDITPQPTTSHSVSLANTTLKDLKSLGCHQDLSPNFFTNIIYFY